MVDEAVIEVLATKMGVTSGGLALEDTLLDSEEQNIESPFPEIEDEDVAAANDLIVEIVGDGGRGGLVDDTEDEKVPASLVAWRCESLKYAGTVTTALFTVVPRYTSAVSFILSRTRGL